MYADEYISTFLDGPDSSSWPSRRTRAHLYDLRKTSLEALIMCAYV